MSVAEARARGQEAAPPSAPGARAPAWALPGGVVLILSLLVGGFALLSSAITLVAGLSNDVDWILFVATLVALLPAALVAGRGLARTLEASAGPAAVSGLAATAAVSLLVILLLSRLAHSLGLPSSALLLPLTAAWGAALALATRTIRRGGRAGAVPLGGDVPRAWILAAALACVCILAFLSPELFRPVELGASLAIAAALTAFHLRLRRSSDRRWAPWLLDAAAVALVIMTVTDVSAYLEYLRPDARTFVLGDGTSVTPESAAFGQRIHQGFWLGPLNDMLHGRAMLVDTSSQYGVGVFYFLAALFQVAPLGYGALSLLVGFLTALQYALAYGVMRLAGCARTLAVPAIAAAVLGLVLGSIGSPADFPSTGALRFGMAWLVVALAVLWARCPRHRRPLRAAATALVGISSVWSFETFAFVSATFIAVAAFEAAALAPGQRRARAFARDILAAAGCCIIAHLALAVGTRAFAGSWPDWSTYLAFLKLYSLENFYFIAVAPWSPGLPVLLLHLASAISLAALLACRHALVRERRPLLLGIAAASGLGIASFSYFLGHSHPNTLTYTALPAVVEGCLWAAAIGDRVVRTPGGPRLVAVGTGFWMVALLAISGWPDATGKWRRTALAHAIPAHEGSIREAPRRLWRSPPSDRRALEAQALLDRYIPRGEPALVIAEPELTVEVLVRSDRVNLLPIGHPEQDSIVPDEADPKVRRVIDGLRPGTLMLTQPGAFALPVKDPGFTVNKGKLVRLQKLALDGIRARFRLEEVDRSPSGLAIVRLLPPRAN